MARTIPFESQAGMPRGRAIQLLVAVLAVVGSAAAVITWRTSSSPPPRRSVPLWDEGSPYANTRAGVRYVGDAACARCHAEIAATYRQHPMGRSLAPIDAATATGGDEAGGRPLFEANGLEYSIERREGRVFHQETRRDSAGRLVARNEAEVQFVLGSGSQGISYLIERDGFLFQSPISWYVQKRRWDLSPGYQRQNAHFDRPVGPLCLYCHANRVELVEGTLNRYQPPIFRGHAIGCERCHGPGELHVNRPTLVDGRDTTIVNPAGLEPALRDAVCEQCHLLGRQRVVKLDRRDDDFRPGLPFDRVWSVFERPEWTAADHFVGQVEQMRASRCYQGSAGRLGCISCHDPHQRPAPEERVSAYRDRCLECHADRGCRLPVAVRRQRGRAEDCTGCHMPRLETSDIAHSAATDHRIPRRPDAGGPTGLSASPSPGSSTKTEDPRRGEPPLVLFHRERMDEPQRAGAERDLGIALSNLGPETAAIALPLLDSALASRPDDVAAWEAKGSALGRLNRLAEGLAAYQRALSRQPDRESAIVGAANLAARSGRREEAIAGYRHVIALNPWRAAYRTDLAA
ncbi:MAG TPA: cytochrome c3 family protein, partial [Isosphaeraceae bacterium]|nr:cytochrome c3 family protein [Isosphaeraceae bacterium]